MLIRLQLHRLPMPRPGEILGLVGTNGIGKSTALNILQSKIKPNLGRFDSPPDWQEILQYFRGSELQNYFTRILENNLECKMKPQFVDKLASVVEDNTSVQMILDGKDQTHTQAYFSNMLDMNHLRDRPVKKLSGGELQRLACTLTCIAEADVYMFDEPSSYLDVKQRLNAGRAIRSLLSVTKYVVVVEHDLAVLDYLSDFVCCLYGKPGVYGVVTMPFSVREGINIFLDGFIPTENMRFRDEKLTFKVSGNAEEGELKHTFRHEYPGLKKIAGNFELTVDAGYFVESQIIVMLGENGTGKTTFIRMLAGSKGFESDNGEQVPSLNVSHKPQNIKRISKFQGSVRQILQSKIQHAYVLPRFITDVMKPLNMEGLMDLEVVNLSGGELQRVAITLALGKPADVYLIDEPSAYLDSEQRLHAAKVIKRFILHAKKTAFVVEHDFIMATYLADMVIVFEGQPGVKTTANTPMSLLIGMNKFLESLEITFRRDPANYRPRINKLNSVKDVEQKSSGNYFFVEDHDKESSRRK